MPREAHERLGHARFRIVGSEAGASVLNYSHAGLRGCGQSARAEQLALQGVTLGGIEEGRAHHAGGSNAQ